MKHLICGLALVFLSSTLGNSATTKTKSSSSAATASGKSTKKSRASTPAASKPAKRNPDSSAPASSSKGEPLAFSKVPVSDKYIAITFDDGPHPKNTPRLLDMLRARNIKATFYVVGSNVDLNPQIVRRTVAEGHEIGNHSYTHRLLSKASDSQIRDELTRCRDAVFRAADVQPHTVRPPYGGLLQRQREWVHAEFGYPTILWAVDPLDWKRPGPSVVCSRILASTTAGSIILAHDLHGQTVDAMPATLDGLLQRGFKFVTVSELLAMRSPAPVSPTTAQTPAH